MINQLKKLTSAVFLASGIFAGQEAFAGLINGTIDFTGTGTLNASIPTATKFTSFKNVVVATGTQTGDYAGTDGTHVTAPKFTFLPVLSPDPVVVWSFVFGGKTYSFSLTGPLTVIKTGVPSLTIEGSGTASITGFTDTPGSFELTTQGKALKLSFSSATTVPEGGSSVVLLGSALVGIAFLRRNLA